MFSSPRAAALSELREVFNIPQSANDNRSTPQLRKISLSIHDDLSSLEAQWRAFEKEADCTAFQTYEWLSAWMRNIAPHHRITPAIVVGRDALGTLVFIMPLAVHHGRFCRTLTWLASDLCDYNAPLLANDFPQHVKDVNFPGLWKAILGLLNASPAHRTDAIVLEKMPERVGSQANPFLTLAGLSLNPNGAYLTTLETDWDVFYGKKRSAATRQRDRSKRKQLAKMGEIRYVRSSTDDEIRATLSVLFEQKARAFHRMGVHNIFANAGQSDFYRDVATSNTIRRIACVTRLYVGDTLASANLGLTFRGRFYHVLASYDDGPASRYSAGAAHLQELLKDAIVAGFREFDFTIGDERYKREWADTIISLHDFRAASTLRGTLVAIPSAIFQRIKRTIKQSPALWRIAVRLRALRSNQHAPAR